LAKKKREKDKGHASMDWILPLDCVVYNYKLVLFVFYIEKMVNLYMLHF
jgi:hypothetical protein